MPAPGFFFNRILEYVISGSGTVQTQELDASSSSSAALATLSGHGTTQNLTTSVTPSATLARQKTSGPTLSVSITPTATLTLKPTALTLFATVQPQATIETPHGQTLMSVTDPTLFPYLEIVWKNQRIGVNARLGGALFHYQAFNAITDTDWHSYALALDTDLGNGTLYIDGRTQASFPIDETTWPGATGKWFMGARPNGSLFFKGGLDEFAVDQDAYDETTAYQITTAGIAGTLLTITSDSGPDTFSSNLTATATSSASLVASKVGAPINFTSSPIGNGQAFEEINITGLLRVIIPVAPAPVPQNFTVTTTAFEAVGQNILSVQPLTVPISAGTTLYFPKSVAGDVGGTGGGTGGSAPPPSGGYFSILPPGSALPSDSVAASMVRRSTWEPRTDNTTANNYVNATTNTLGNFSDFDASWNSTYKTRINGNFTGTTDEIIQWAACKWGWSDELLRAECVTESTWHQSTLGDNEPASNGHRVFDRVDDPSPTSFSIIQVKWYFHPSGTTSGTPQSSYPLIHVSTAFALDLFLATMRGIYDGHSTFLNGGGAGTVGDYYGAIGSWFSGAWHDAGAASYIANVQSDLANKIWLTW